MFQFRTCSSYSLSSFFHRFCVSLVLCKSTFSCLLFVIRSLNWFQEWIKVRIFGFVWPCQQKNSNFFFLFLVLSQLFWIFGFIPLSICQLKTICSWWSCGRGSQTMFGFEIFKEEFDEWLYFLIFSNMIVLFVLC